MKQISEREQELPDSMLGMLSEIASEHKEIISISVGEPDFDAPKPIIEAVKKAALNYKKNQLSHYSSHSGRSDLKEAIIKKLRKENKINARKENILVTCGSQEAIFAGLLSTLDPSEEIILSNPGYLGYIPAIELVNANPVYVRLKEENNFEIEPDKIKEAINKKTQVILINTPSNPTGNVISKKILEEIADIAREYDLYIFCDEAYERLVYDKKHFSMGSLNGMEDYVVSFYTFSKSYAMCGFRLGYAVGPKDLTDAMAKTAQYMTLSPPTISQLVGLEALKMSNMYIEAMRKEYDERRRFIVKKLNEIGLRTKIPNGAFYTFSNIKDVTKKNSHDFALDLLKKAKVAVVPGSEFGRHGEGYIRCSYAAKLPLIKEAMNRIEKYLK
ncbi:pyridoxal phosphate-dependent aminotransferase [Candidatus Woesearchaeota archaeon]|nr:pyridoxal phosphate-dependent aminotransferase [Candidatus Woesearchaeota archaeon]